MSEGTRNRLLDSRPQRRATLFLLLLLVGVTTAVAAATIALLYQNAFRIQEARLVEVAKSQARLIESVARFDRSNQPTPEAARAGTLSQIANAHATYEGSGDTGEFTVAERKGDTIVFLIRHRHSSSTEHEVVPFQAPSAEPMRRALLGLSGTLVGLDYRGAVVLAAHEPLPFLGCGLVAKIDLAEVRAPFIRAALIGGALDIALIALGVFLFYRGMRPILGEQARSLARFRLALDAAPNGMMLIDERKKIVLANVTVEELFGYGAGELLGHSLDDLVPGRAEAGEADAKRKDGGEFPVEVALTPLTTDSGRFELASIVDVTERKEAARVAVAIADATARADAAAQARARIEELLSASQAQAEELEAQQEELRQTNDELQEQTQQLEEERGRVEERNRQLADARKSLEERAEALARASQYKSDFLANMSHELRTPLNSLLILAKLLSENSSSNLTLKQVEHARTIHGAGVELLSLINEVLDLSKVEAGKLNLELVDYPIDDLARYLERTFEPVAQENGLVFRVVRASDLPRAIHTDIQRFQQVMKNLLSNAFKFTHEGEVEVKISRASETSLAIAVRDTGIGIPESKLQAVFEAFRQIHGGDGRNYGGTGLGLSISRQLARLLGGDILLESRVGTGSTFTFRVPIRHSVTEPTGLPTAAVVASEKNESPELPAQVVSDDREAIRPGDRVLLVIEDDLRFAAVMLESARERRFKVVVAADGASGIAIARKVQPDAITLDMQLPDMNGWTVLDRLKHDPATRHIPIHILSADDQRQRGMSQGAVTFLQKPIELEKLADALASMLLAGGPKRLLLVEDDERQRRAIIELLGGEDATITAVATGREALRALEEKRFDCMVLDLGLPDMPGIDLIEKIQAAQSSLPIIVYTARELRRDEELRLQAASKAIVVKDARSPERLLAETSLFLHRVESEMKGDKQHTISQVHARDESLEGRKVLVVDDDMRNIFALSSVLEHHGMQVAFAESGPDALEMLRVGAFDAVLMDIMLPGMDGYETTRAIRKMPEYAKLPIIAVTAKAMKGDREKCLEAGTSDYITKPVDTDQLLSLLRVWLYQARVRSA